MAIDIATIAGILNGGGTLRYVPGDAGNPYAGGLQSDFAEHAEANQILCKITIGQGDIALRGMAEGSSGADAVNVCYVGDRFTYGRIGAPGYIYSDGFSGCSFYLYRAPGDDLWGVHASRQRGSVRDPTGFFARRGFKLLWQWDSMGKLSDQQLLGGRFSAVFCAIDQNDLHGFALTMNGQRVEAVRDSTWISDWRRFDRPPNPPIASAPTTPSVSPLTRVMNLLRR